MSFVRKKRGSKAACFSGKGLGPRIRGAFSSVSSCREGLRMGGNTRFSSLCLFKLSETFNFSVDRSFIHSKGGFCGLETSVQYAAHMTLERL